MLSTKEAIQKLNAETRDYLTSKQVSTILTEVLGEVKPTTVTSYCRQGLFKGSKNIDNSWQIPKLIILNIILNKESVEENYFTVIQLAKKLGISQSPIKRMINNGELKAEEITILTSKGIYISKHQQKLRTLLVLKEKLDTGDFVSRSEVAKELKLDLIQLPNLENRLPDKDKFVFFKVAYVKRKSLEGLIKKHKRKEGYITVSKAAERLGKSKSSVQNYCKEGVIPDAYMSRNTWMVPCNYVEEILLAGKEVQEKYMSINKFSEKVGQTRQTVTYRIKKGDIPHFQKIEGRWLIPVDKVSEYIDNYEWLQRETRPVVKTDDYYSKENMIKEFKERVFKIINPEIPEITDLFIQYVTQVIGKTRSKGSRVKDLVAENVNMYKKILLLLSKDIGEGIEDDIQSALIKTTAPVYVKKRFCTFIDFAFALKDIELKKKFSIKENRKEEDDEELELYSPEIYQEINLYARRIEDHLPRALRSASYANMWVYVLIHLTDVWRHSDIVEKVPPITLEQIGISRHDWFKENRMSMEQCQTIINELHIKLRPECTNKTRSYLTFLVEPTLVECVAHAVVISELHRRRKGSEKLLFTFITRAGRSYNIAKNHLYFFDKKPELKMFRNRKMNRSTMTYLYYHLVEEDADNADIALSFVKYSRSHKDKKENPGISDTTSIYVKVMNKDGSINKVSENLFKRGHFGWLYNYMILLALEDTEAIQSLEERTNTIETLRNEIKLKELEDWAHFLNDNYQKRQNVIQQLSRLPENDLIELIKKIFNQEMPAKTNPGQCMVYPSCKYPSRKNCFGCEYFIPQLYVLLEAAKEFRRLVRSMNKARYESTFKRDERLLITALTILSEAKVTLPKEQVYSFISLDEIREGIQNLRSKKFVE